MFLWSIRTFCKNRKNFKTIHKGYQYFFSGCLAGAGVLTLTNPIWVTKTQQCLQYEEGALKQRTETMFGTLSKGFTFFRFWRNSNLNFNNQYSLIKSLEEKPKKDWLRKIHECEDEKALKYFIRDKNLNISE